MPKFVVEFSELDNTATVADDEGNTTTIFCDAWEMDGPSAAGTAIRILIDARQADTDQSFQEIVDNLADEAD